MSFLFHWTRLAHKQSQDLNRQFMGRRLNQHTPFRVNDALSAGLSQQHLVMRFA